MIDPSCVVGTGVARRLREQFSYLRAMWALNQLDSATLDDIGIAREHFPALARRHARGLPSVAAASLAA